MGGGAALFSAVTPLLSACGVAGETGDGAGSANALGMSIASFDNAADRATPVMVGISDIEGNVLAFGSIELTIEATQVSGTPLTGSGLATFLPVPGRPERQGDAPAEPIWGPPSAGVGVYQTEPMQLAAGFYEISAVVDGPDGKQATLRTGLEVLGRSRVLLPGDRAPTTRNAVIGTPNVAAAEIDSRASTADDLDPRIHGTVIADALAAGKRLVVAITTPVYCQSKFCGPITDVVASMADDYPDVAFVHLEVWKNFETKEISPAAATWIFRDADEGRGANEPWVFFVDADGVITHRWGNVLNEAELRSLLV
jgi:hypothetical protein